jgi:hypothetical protein
MFSKKIEICEHTGWDRWKPMYASDVDRLGYGDCKALTNYNESLLEAVDVPSYNTILYGDRCDIELDLSDLCRGNHMILVVPNGGMIIPG